MAVSILEGKDGYKCLYCPTTMIAFGGIFYENEDPKEFLKWLKIDPRALSDTQLDARIFSWRYRTIFGNYPKKERDKNDN